MHDPTRPPRRRRRTLGAIVGAVVVAFVAIMGAFALVPRTPGVPAAAPTSTAGPRSTPAPSDPAASPAPTSTPAPPTHPAPVPSPTSAPAPRDLANPIDDPASVWVVVNKARPLSGAEAYVPELAELPDWIPNPNGHRLRPEARDALVSMAEAAQAEIGATLVAQSGYRSYATQASIFSDYVSSLGRSAAEQRSASPGHSEHQTGLAVDLLDTTSGCSIGTPCFGDTDTGRWLAANAHRFGFLLRYPADQTAVTGFTYEPWHFRYVGPELSAELHSTGIATLEEFFGLPPAPDYL